MSSSAKSPSRAAGDGDDSGLGSGDDETADHEPSQLEVSAEDLPGELPIFPLTGSLLLPGGLLPLHLFEARYRHMAEDVLASHRFIGMIQPQTPNLADNRGEGEVGVAHELYDIGCAGRIEQHQILPFGRFLIVLRGACRFRIESELSEQRGYRRVRADYQPFLADLEEDAGEIEGHALLEALATFSQERGVDIELDRLHEVPTVSLLNGLAMSLPLAPVEKQALLEAEDVAARHAMLLALLEMGLTADETPAVTH